MKNLAFAIILASAAWTSAVGMAQQGCPTVASCASQGRVVIDQPVGLIDGKNDTFHISASPVPEAKVQLFVDGLKLTEGTDFRRVDQEITVNQDAIPQPGSTVRVAFERPSEQGASSATENLGVSRRAKALIRQLLIESALKETAPIQAAAVQAQPATTSTDVSPATKPVDKQLAVVQPRPPQALDVLPLANTDSVPPQPVVSARQVASAQIARKVSGSFSLLARQIKRHDGDSRSSKKRLDDFGQGYEGLGDLSVVSPYGFLSQPDADNNGRSSPQSSSRAVSGKSVLRSLSMLQKRLDDTDDSDTPKREDERQ